jgi:hypothetical protein
LKQVAEKAAATAAIKKLLEKAQDEFWLANHEVRELERQIPTFQVTSSGVVYPAGFHRRVERAVARAQEAEGVFQQARDRAQKANGELFRAQKARELWDIQEEHLASQRDAEAALPPDVRERRALRARLAELEGGR